MPALLTWDTPGLTWDSGATWDGVEASPPPPSPTKRKAMNNTKAIIDFSSYTAAELGPIAHNIHDKMVDNATTFTAPTVTMATLLTEVTDYDAKLIARASRASTDILAFNTARDELEASLASLGGYVNGIAKGDPVIVDKSGFPSYNTAQVIDTSAPAGPADLRLKHGDLPGTLVARYKPDRQPNTNEVQANTADPNNEADWHTKGMFLGGRADLDGFTPGIVVWVRVRTVGLKGVMGAWSDPAQIRVL